jgi:hypothetical protein
VGIVRAVTPRRFSEAVSFELQIDGSGAVQRTTGKLRCEAGVERVDAPADGSGSGNALLAWRSSALDSVTRLGRRTTLTHATSAPAKTLVDAGRTLHKEAKEELLREPIGITQMGICARKSADPLGRCARPAGDSGVAQPSSRRLREERRADRCENRCEVIGDRTVVGQAGCQRGAQRP